MRVLLKECNDIHFGSSIQTREIIRKFDDFLSSINYPHFIHRRVLNFRLFNEWKASQLRVFLLYLALPFLLCFRDYFPSLLIYHFSLYCIYIRTLCKFNDQQYVYDVHPFIETYLHRFSEFYSKSKELLSTHCNIHLWQQVIRHGSLSVTRYNLLIYFFHYNNIYEFQFVAGINVLYIRMIILIMNIIYLLLEI